MTDKKQQEQNKLIDALPEIADLSKQLLEELYKPNASVLNLEKSIEQLIALCQTHHLFRYPTTGLFSKQYPLTPEALDSAKVQLALHIQKIKNHEKENATITSSPLLDSAIKENARIASNPLLDTAILVSYVLDMCREKILATSSTKPSSAPTLVNSEPPTLDEQKTSTLPSELISELSFLVIDMINEPIGPNFERFLALVRANGLFGPKLNLYNIDTFAEKISSILIKNSPRETAQIQESITKLVPLLTNYLENIKKLTPTGIKPLEGIIGKGEKLFNTLTQSFENIKDRKEKKFNWSIGINMPEQLTKDFWQACAHAGLLTPPKDQSEKNFTPLQLLKINLLRIKKDMDTLPDDQKLVIAQQIQNVEDLAKGFSLMGIIEKGEKFFSALSQFFNNMQDNKDKKFNWSISISTLEDLANDCWTACNNAGLLKLPADHEQADKISTILINLSPLKEQFTHDKRGLFVQQIETIEDLVAAVDEAVVRLPRDRFTEANVIKSYQDFMDEILKNMQVIRELPDQSAANGVNIANKCLPLLHACGVFPEYRQSDYSLSEIINLIDDQKLHARHSKIITLIDEQDAKHRALTLDDSKEEISSLNKCQTLIENFKNIIEELNIKLERTSNNSATSAPDIIIIDDEKNETPLASSFSAGQSSTSSSNSSFSLGQPSTPSSTSSFSVEQPSTSSSTSSFSLGQPSTSAQIGVNKYPGTKAIEKIEDCGMALTKALKDLENQFDTTILNVSFKKITGDGGLLSKFTNACKMTGIPESKQLSEQGFPVFDLSKIEAFMFPCFEDLLQACHQANLIRSLPPKENYTDIGGILLTLAELELSVKINQQGEEAVSLKKPLKLLNRLINLLTLIPATMKLLQEIADKVTAVNLSIEAEKQQFTNERNNFLNRTLSHTSSTTFSAITSSLMPPLETVETATSIYSKIRQGTFKTHFSFLDSCEHQKLIDTLVHAIVEGNILVTENLCKYLKNKNSSDFTNDKKSGSREEGDWQAHIVQIANETANDAASLALGILKPPPSSNLNPSRSHRTHSEHVVGTRHTSNSSSFPRLSADQTPLTPVRNSTGTFLSTTNIRLESGSFSTFSTPPLVRAKTPTIPPSSYLDNESFNSNNGTTTISRTKSDRNLDKQEQLPPLPRSTSSVSRYNTSSSNPATLPKSASSRGFEGRRVSLMGSINRPDASLEKDKKQQANDNNLSELDNVENSLATLEKQGYGELGVGLGRRTQSFNFQTVNKLTPNGGRKKEGTDKDNHQENNGVTKK